MKRINDAVKRRKCCFAIVFLLFSFNLAQSADHIRQVVDQVADRIIQSASYGFVNIKTGERYANVEGIPDTANIKSESHYTTWFYILNGGEATLSDGTFCRPKPRKMTIWGDDLYMGISLIFFPEQGTVRERVIL